MFSYCHYVPVLRWKRAEKIALRHLNSADKVLITPLIELIPANFVPGKDRVEKDPAEVMNCQAEEIRKNWGTTPFFIDLGLVERHLPQVAGATHPLDYLGSRAEIEGIRLIPVTALDRRGPYQDAVMRVASGGSGVCLRLSARDVLQPGFSSNIAALVDRLHLEHRQIDVVLDYQVFDRSAANLATLIQQIPNIESWRTLTVACGAFPQDLQQFTPGRHTIHREDWISWRTQTAQHLCRKPSFSDYTVQYGIYIDPPSRSNPSASIRYTLAEEWLIMRGEGIFNEDGPGHEQYIANAMLLCDSDDFYGQGFSYGDGYIFDVSQGIQNHGNPETWIRAGINHHITVVARQIASLAAS
jgi:Beta protein